MSSRQLFIFDLDNCLSNGMRREKLAGPEPDRKREKEQHDAWLNVVMQNFEADKAVPELALLLRRLYLDAYTPSFIVTARNEEHRDATERWLKRLFNPMPILIMRPRFNVAPSALWKESIIRELIGRTGGSNVCVIDDDTRNELAPICSKNGWVFLKAILPK